MLDTYAGSVIYFDAGSYLVTNTLTVHPGTRIVGELWAQLVASVSRGGMTLPWIYPRWWCLLITMILGTCVLG